MNNRFDKMAQDLLNSPSGAKLSAHSSELQKLADSSDGQKVKEMLDRNGGLSDAFEKGDVEALRQKLAQVMQTDAGSRLAKQLSDLMK